MTKKLLMLVAIGAASLTFGATVQAQGLRIELGDRPYYSHGPRYWAGDYEMIWVPGHWSPYRHHWIHGHYIRSEQRRHWRNRDRIDADIRFDTRR